MSKHKSQNKFKAQNPNNKILVLIFGIGILNLFCHLDFGICHLFAAEEQISENAEQLERRILANPKENARALEELAGLYFAGGRYNPFADFLGKLAKTILGSYSYSARP